MNRATQALLLFAVEKMFGGIVLKQRPIDLFCIAFQKLKEDDFGRGKVVQGEGSPLLAESQALCVWLTSFSSDKLNSRCLKELMK